MKRLEGKIALVTGGSSGIGQATASAFAREGAKVVIADVQVEGSTKTLQMIKKVGSEGIFVKTDVSQAGEVESLIKKVVESYGRLDCAFNNAGIETERSFTADCSEAVWDRVINTNLKGVWLCLKYEIRQMITQGGGVIVNTASTMGLVGFPGSPAYIASKHGIMGLTKAAALEYAKDGIRINAVCPTVTMTPMIERAMTSSPDAFEILRSMHPMGRFAKVEDIAEAVVWLCSDATSYITGQPVVVDGGYIAQ